MKIFKERIGDKGPWCVLVHGLGEHSGRYRHLVGELRSKNFGVVIFDLKGHGRSEGRRGDIMSFEDYLDNVDEAVSLINGEKFHLFGHSMGGLIALRYALERGERVISLVVSAPLLRIKKEVPKLKIVAGRILYRVLPSFAMNNEVDPRLLSHDESVVEAYLNDPLVHNRVTVRWFFKTTEAMKDTFARAEELKVPTLFIHGSHDGLTDPSATKEFYERMRTKKRLIIYEGYYHEPFNELGGSKVLNDISSWFIENNEYG